MPPIRCSWVRGRPLHHGGSRSYSFRPDLSEQAGNTLSVAGRWRDVGAKTSEHGWSWERAGSSSAGGEGLFNTSFTVCIVTSCKVVLWPPRRVLVCMMGMLDRLCLSVSDILRVTLVACVQRTSRGSFAFACAAAHRPRRFMVKPACRPTSTHPT